jgi:hypothetical protein
MWFALSVGFFGFAVILHGALMRLPLQIDSVRRFLFAGVPLGVVLVTLAISSYGFTNRGIAPIFVYAFFCELYIFCFTLALSSVSAKLLILLRGGPINASTLDAASDPREMVNLRLERLTKNGFIVQRPKHLILTDKGQKVLRAFRSLRRFFRHVSN